MSSQHHRVDWVDVWKTFGADPDEGQSMGQLMTMYDLYPDGPDDADARSDHLQAAIDGGAIEKVNGEWYPKYHAPDPKEEPQSEGGEDDDEAEPEQQADDNPTPAPTPDEDVEYVRREEFETIVEEKKELQRTINSDLALLKGTLKKLLGAEGTPLEELPEHAAERAETIDTHDTVIRDLADQVAAFDDMAVDELDGQGKIAKIRRHMVEQAQQRDDGTYKMNYREIHSLLDGSVGESYANQLVNKAALGHDAFTVEENGGTKPKQLVVRTQKIAPESVYRVNNSSNGGDA